MKINFLNKNGLHPLVRAAIATMKQARDEYRLAWSMSGRSRFGQRQVVDFPVQGDYLVTTDTGIFRLGPGYFQRVGAVPAFGIAIYEDAVYLATWTEHHSMILRGSRQALLTEGVSQAFTEIYRVAISNHGARIHQICVTSDCVWIANTPKNSLTKIDRHTGEWLAEIAPIACSFGAPITTDHNHINSVTALDRVLLFTALKIGRQALLGICGQGLVRCYAYRNLGVHDIHITGERVIFSDSYGFNDAGSEGMVIDNWQGLAPDYFAASPQFFVRGVAGCGDEMVIGCSYVGDRRERFKGKGSLLLAQKGRVTHQVALPSPQIYDIIQTDGKSFSTPSALTGFEEISQVFQQHLGPPIIEVTLAEAMVHSSGKKYDDRDLGKVEELQ